MTHTTDTTAGPELEPAEDCDGLELCEDCTQLAANGEVSPRWLSDLPAYLRADALEREDGYLLELDTDDADDNPASRHAARMSARWPRHRIVVTCSGDEEDCTPFTWSSCDGCGSSLGGSRHAGAALAIVRPQSNRARVNLG